MKKMLRKILRSLPKRFDMKVTTIEEAQDIFRMLVDELIRSLQNFELVVDNRTEKKVKDIAFTTNTSEEDGPGEVVDDENLSENLVLLGRQFNKILKQVNKRPKGNVQNIKFNIDKQQSNVKNERTDEKNNQYKGVHVGTKCV